MDLNQRHLMTALRGYEDFYSTRRPHRALNQAAPLRPLPDGVTDLDHIQVTAQASPPAQAAALVPGLRDARPPAEPETPTKAKVPPPDQAVRPRRRQR